MGGYMDYALYQKISKVTLGKQPADLVLKNLKLVDVFTGEIVESNVAVKDGLIAGVSSRRLCQTDRQSEICLRFLQTLYSDVLRCCHGSSQIVI